MLERVPEEDELAEVFVGLYGVHEAVNKIDAEQLGHLSFFKGTDTYLESSRDVRDLAQEAREILRRARALRRRAQIEAGRSPSWSGVVQFGEAVVATATTLEELCFGAWKKRALGEEYSREKYRRDLREASDAKIEAGKLYGTVSTHLDREGVLRVAFEPRWSLVICGALVGVGLGGLTLEVFQPLAVGCQGIALRLGWPLLWMVLGSLAGLLVGAKRVPVRR